MLSCFGIDVSNAFSTTTGYCAPGSIVVTTTGSIPLATAGGTYMTITGTNFGNNINNITVSYWPSATPSLIAYDIPCVFINYNTKLGCTTVAWIGQSLFWRVNVTGQAITSAASTYSYATPSVSSVSSNSNGDNELATAGDVLTFTGTSFGPTGLSITSSFGPTLGTEYSLTGCQWVQSQTKVKCTVPAAVGTSLKLKLTIGSQTVSISGSITVQYAAPSITLYNPVAIATSGGTVVLTGANYGPNPSTIPWTTTISASYGTSTSYNTYVATGCTWNSQTQVSCNAPGGIGVNYRWIITIGSQTSVGSASPVFGYNLLTIATNPFSSTLYDTDGGGLNQTITGTNFGPAGTLTTVTFGTLLSPTLFTCSSAKVIVANTKISCVIPASYGNGYYWTVTVGGQTATSTATTGCNLPTISSISPTTAGLSLSTSSTSFITLTGTNFGASGSGASLSALYASSSYSYIPTGCTVQSHTSIQCKTVVGVGRDLVWKVTVANLASITTTVTTSYTPPSITGVSSTSATITSLNIGGSESITISGSNLGPTLSTLTATYGSILPYVYAFATSGCAMTSAHNTIVCTTLSGTGASLMVNVTVGGQLAVATTRLSYASPTISSISPALVSTAGLRIVVNGANFGLPLQATSSCLSPILVSSTSMTCLTPSATSATSILLSVSVGTQVSNAVTLYYYTFDTRSLSPPFGHFQLSTPVIITGQQLNRGIASSAIVAMSSMAHPTPVTQIITISSAISMSFTIPAGVFNVPLNTPSLTVNISVTMNGIESENMTSFIVYRTDVSSISVHSGPLGGQTSLSITGVFYPTGTVSFRLGSVYGIANYISSTSITVITGGTSTVAYYNPEVSTEVSSTNKLWASGTGIFFQYYTEPSLTSLIPPLAPLVGGTTIRPVSTTGYITTSEATCRFGSAVVAASFEIVSSVVNILCLVPAQSAGSVSVEVALNGQQYTSNNLQMLYYPVPSVTRVEPSIGPVRGGTLVTMKGSNFVTSSYIRIRHTFPNADTITVVGTYGSSTEIIFTSPTSIDETVTQNATLQLSLDNQVWTDITPSLVFTYYTPASITTVVPVLGVVTGGTSVYMVAMTQYRTGYLYAQFTDVTGQATTVSCTLSENQVDLQVSGTCITPSALAPGTAIVRLSVDSASGIEFSSAVTSFYYYTNVPMTSYMSPAAAPLGNTSNTYVLVNVTAFTLVSIIAPSTLPIGIRIGQTATQIDGFVSTTETLISNAPRDHLIPFVIVNDLPLSSTTWMPSHTRMIVVDTRSLILNGVLDSLCATVHFSTVSLSSGQIWTELPFFIEPETCYTTTTRFHVRIPSIAPSSSLTVNFVYRYFPSGATTNRFEYGSDGTTTFDFFDRIPEMTSDPWVYSPYNPTNVIVNRLGSSRTFTGVYMGHIAPRTPLAYTIDNNTTREGVSISGEWYFNSTVPGSTTKQCVSHQIYWSPFATAPYTTTESSVMELLSWNCNGNVSVWTGGNWYYNAAQLTIVNLGNGLSKVRVTVELFNGRIWIINDIAHTRLGGWKSSLNGPLYFYARSIAATGSGSIPTTELRWMAISTVIWNWTPTYILQPTTTTISTWAIPIVVEAAFGGLNNNGHGIVTSATSSISLNFNDQVDLNNQWTLPWTRPLYQVNVSSYDPPLIPVSSNSSIILTIYGANFPDSGIVQARVMGTTTNVITCLYKTMSMITCPPPSSTILQTYVTNGLSIYLELSFDGAQHFTSVTNLPLNVYQVAFPSQAIYDTTSMGGPIEGGNSLTITVMVSNNILTQDGFYPFFNSSNGVLVTFGNVPLSIQSSSALLDGRVLITVIVPPSPTGDVGVVNVTIAVYRFQSSFITSYLYMCMSCLTMTPHGIPASHQVLRDSLRTKIRYIASSPAALPVIASTVHVTPLVARWILTPVGSVSACYGNYSMLNTTAAGFTTASISQRSELLSFNPTTSSNSSTYSFPFFNATIPLLTTYSLWSLAELQEIGLKPGDSIRQIQLQISSPWPNVHYNNFEIALAWMDSSLTTLSSPVGDASFTVVYSSVLLTMNQLRTCTTTSLSSSSVISCWVSFDLPTPLLYSMESALVIRLRRENLSNIKSWFGSSFSPSGSLVMRSTLFSRSYVVSTGTGLSYAVRAVPALQLLSNRMEISFFPIDSSVPTPYLFVPSISQSWDVPQNDSWQWNTWRMCSYSDVTISSFSPAKLDRSIPISVQLSGIGLDGGSQLDRSLITVRFVIVNTNGKYYINVPGTLRAATPSTKAYVTAVTPDEASYGARQLVLNVNVDVTLNGFVYTEPYHPLSVPLVLFDTPSIVSFTPKSSPQLGGGQVAITARNIIYSWQKVWCMWTSVSHNLTSIGYASNTNGTIGNCNGPCYLLCAIPPIPVGPATLAISLNNYQWSTATDQFMYTGCSQGTVTSSYLLPCSKCGNGTYATSDGSSCAQCPLNTYNPNTGVQNNCTSCPGFAKTSTMGRKDFMDCLCPGATTSSRGYYKPNSNDNTPCRTCPDFATCPGGWALPIPLDGYALDKVTNSSVFICDPPDSCIAASSSGCGDGYDNAFDCLACSPDYYRAAGRCWKCDSRMIQFVSLKAIIIGGLNILVVFGIWWYIDIFVELSSLTAFASLSNGLIVISFMRVIWPSNYVLAFPIFYYIGNVFFWPDIVSLAAPECVWGPLEQTTKHDGDYFQRLFYEYRLEAPLLWPPFQVVLIVAFSIISALKCQRQPWSWTPFDRCINAIFMILTLEFPFIFHHLLAPWVSVPRENIAPRQWIRPAMEYLGGPHLIFINVACVLCSPFLASLINFDVSNRDNSRWLMAIFKQFNQQTTYQRRWSFGLTLCMALVVSFHSHSSCTLVLQSTDLS
jgi:hypothetical protein